MPLSLLQKAVHNIQINEQTFSVANSVILKLPIFNQMSPKKLPSRWNQKSPKKIATLESKVAKYSPLYLKSNTKP